MENDISALINRISQLESKLARGVVVQSKSVEGNASHESEAQPPKKIELEKAVPADVQYVADNWGSVIRHVEAPTAKQKLHEAMLSVKGENTLLIVFDSYGMGYEVCSKDEVVQQLEDIIANELQKEVKVEVKKLENGQNFVDHFVEVKKKINMDIFEEDF